MDQAWVNQLPIKNITLITPVRGGDVNDAYKIDTPTQSYFLKVQPRHDKIFYDGEVKGLKELKKAGITVPDVISTGEINGDAYLLLTYLESGYGSQRELGQMVAKMHHYKSANQLFGFDADYHGTNVTFSNAWTDSWSKLFVEQRMDVLAQLLLERDHWSQEAYDRYLIVRSYITQVLSRHTSTPSLLHGDLWGGNYMFLADGRPALFDPASMYGDREFDLGITSVFGGFSSDFYEAYNEMYPLNEGWELRIEFYRLYIFMIHLLKFGRTYQEHVDNTMSKIISYFDNY